MNPLDNIDVRGNSVERKIFSLNLHEIQEEKQASSANYKNRDEFIQGVHVETRSGDLDSHFELQVAKSEEWPQRRVICRTETIGAYVRYALSFPLPECEPGDIVLLNWIARSTGFGDGACIPRLMFCNGSKQGKAHALPTQTATAQSDEWNNFHLFLQIIAPVSENLFHVVFEMEPQTVVEIADLRVERLGFRPLAGEVEPRDKFQTLYDIVALPVSGLSDSDSREEDGLLIEIGAASVGGIAWNRADPFRSVSLGVMIDGVESGIMSSEPMSSLDADNPIRPGLLKFQFPQSIADGQTHAFRLRFASDDRDLTGSPFDKKVTSLQEGLVQIMDPASISGWAVDLRHSPDPATIEISLDDSFRVEIEANERHSILIGPRYNNGHCAFRFELPLAFQDGNPHVLSARVKDGALLAGTPLTFSVTQDHVIFDARLDGAGRISGWASDLRQPDSPLTLAIWLDGKLYGHVRADQPTKILQGSRAGFTVPIPLYAQRVEIKLGSDETIADFDVVRADDHNELRRRLNTSVPSQLVSNDAPHAAMGAGADLFDAEWYRAAYASLLPDLGAEKLDLHQHWSTQGQRDLLNPCPWFDEIWYRANYPDAVTAIEAGEVASGFAHWLSVSDSDWRKVSPYFDPIAARDAFGLDEPTPRMVLDAWRAFRNTPPAPRHAVEPPKSAEAYRSIITARRQPSLIYDFYARKLLEDLSVSDAPQARALEAKLDRNETDLIEWSLNRPISERPLVSVIMPTFNRGFLIAEAIQSLLDQSWENWELLVCDDGSTDKTAFVVKEFDDPRIRFLSLEKANGAVARNFGMRFAKGTYIAFLDSDNLWHPLFLEAAIRELHTQKTGIVYAGYIDTQTKGVRFIQGDLKFTAFDYQSLLRRNYIDLNTIVIDRKIYDYMGGFDEGLGRVQDWDLMLKYTRLVEGGGIPLFGAFYRRNPAWGQVTDLLASTDFNALVSARALERLSAAQELLTDINPTRSLSIIAGHDIRSAHLALRFAALAAELASTRVILPDDAGLRASIPNDPVARALRLIWVAADESPLDHLAGEAVIVTPDVSPDVIAALDAKIPVLTLNQPGDLMTLANDAKGAGTVLIGGAHLFQPPAKEATKAPVALSEVEAARKVLIVVDADAQDAWARELVYRSRSDYAAVLVSIASDGRSETHLFAGGRERLLATDETSIPGCVPECHAIVVMTESNESNSLSVTLALEAFRAEVLVAALGGSTLQPWLQIGVARELASAPPAKILSQMDKVFDDTKLVERLIRKARRRFDHLYSRNVALDRVKIALALKLEH